jgi:hypothetical protein
LRESVYRPEKLSGTTTLSPSLSVQTDRDCYLPSFQSQPGYKPESSGSGQLVSAVVADNIIFPQFTDARLTMSLQR